MRFNITSRALEKVVPIASVTARHAVLWTLSERLLSFPPKL